MGYNRRFMFATGIENSYPVITAKDGTSKRMDEMALCHHYERWREDFSLVSEMGLECSDGRPGAKLRVSVP